MGVTLQCYQNRLKVIVRVINDTLSLKQMWFLPSTSHTRADFSRRWWSKLFGMPRWWQSLWDKRGFKGIFSTVLQTEMAGNADFMLTPKSEHTAVLLMPFRNALFSHDSHNPQIKVPVNEGLLRCRTFWGWSYQDRSVNLQPLKHFSM